MPASSARPGTEGMSHSGGGWVRDGLRSVGDWRVVLLDHHHNALDSAVRHDIPASSAGSPGRLIGHPRDYAENCPPQPDGAHIREMFTLEGRRTSRPCGWQC